MKKRLLTSMLAICLLLSAAVFTGCLGKIDRGDFDIDLRVEDPSTLQGSIRIALPSSGNKRDVFDEAITRYKATRPGVTVNVDWKPLDDFYQSYQTDVATGLVFPDAAYIDHVYAQSLAEFEMIAVLNSVFDHKPYITGLAETGKLGDNYFGFPFTANSTALFYNKDIIGNTPPATYEEFKATCARVKLEQAAAGTNYNPFTLWLGATAREYGSMTLNSWVARHNGMLLSPDLKTSRINSEPVKKALAQWKEIHDNGWVNRETHEEGLFYLGQVGMMEIGSWSFAQMSRESVNYSVAPLFPLYEGGPVYSSVGTGVIVVTTQADENKMKMAADFAKFISTDKILQLNYAKEVQVLPVTKEALEDEYFNTPEWQVFVDMLQKYVARPGSPEWQYICNEVGNMFSNVLTRGQAIDTAVSNCDRLIQNRLDDLYS